MTCRYDTRVQHSSIAADLSLAWLQFAIDAGANPGVVIHAVKKPGVHFAYDAKPGDVDRWC